MYENIYEALEEWDWACFDENDEDMRKAGKAITQFKEHYSKTGEIAPKPKVVGVFSGSMCSLYVGRRRIATIYDLVYSGRASTYDDTRLYKNSNTHLWLDYAVYE